ncbi:MAG: hypothetical protein WBO17_06045 [Sphingorhabdus sp.]
MLVCTMGSLDLAVQLWRPAFDIGIADALIFSPRLPMAAVVNAMKVSPKWRSVIYPQIYWTREIVAVSLRTSYQEKNHFYGCIWMPVDVRW